MPENNVDRNEEKDARLINNRSVADYVQKWGNPTSVGLFDPACKIFSTPTIDGIIGYRTNAKCTVVFGDPICAPQDIPALTQAFGEYCRDKNIVYICTSEQFAQWALKHDVCKVAIEVGYEIVLNPMQNPTAGTGKNASRLRNRQNQSTRNGISVYEYTGNDLEIESALEQVSKSWLQNRQGPQIYFSHINVFADRTHKRWFYATYKGKIVGVLMLNRLDARQGWFINVLMLLPDAPHGTSEFIILCTLDVLRQEGCQFFSVGSNPGTALGTIQGLNPVLAWLARTAFKLVIKIFRLNNRQRYWKKFNPTREPSYVLFSKSLIGVGTALGIIKALNVSDE